MTGRPHLLTYCLDWHLGKSDALLELLARPLEPYVEIEPVAWEGQELEAPPRRDATLVFLQLPPPRTLLDEPERRLVWVPMWDHAWGYEQAWWDALPPTLRVVAFSDAVAERAQAAGLPTLRLTFFGDPARCAPAPWEGPRVLFYWNRTGLAEPRFLARICDALEVTELIFRPDLDPRIDPARAYELPARLGSTRVRRVSFDDRESYLRGTRDANVFLAPRLREGVGMTFVEALARGCAVLACDAPTMSEYVEHERTGFLFRPPVGRGRGRLAGRAAAALRIPAAPHVALPMRQDWRALSRFDAAAAGALARGEHALGFEAWSASLPGYARFLADW